MGAESISETTSVKRKPVYSFIKRCFDIIISLCSIIILSPILLLALLAVFIENPKESPVFKQNRVGLDGKVFRRYKFRSMAPAGDGKSLKVTGIGRFLRATAIDRFPQLFNILKGDMSFVGPRPAYEREVKVYTEEQRNRLSVRPGITCIWQSAPARETVSFADWMKMDLEYVEKRSVGLDLSLIFKAVFSVFSGR